MSMFHERRASARRVVDSPGSIVPNAGEMPQDCVVADISDGGARLVAQTNVPDDFVLIINDGSDVRHTCRVVWRLDDEVGVEFV